MLAIPNLDFSKYLKWIKTHYEKWWETDALTATIAARQATFTFEQKVQTEEKDQSDPERSQKTRTIRLPLIAGIQDYAKVEPVLVIGSLGVGKTSALLRCLVEYAKQELAKPKPEKIPVLIRLKNYDSKLVSVDDRSGLLGMIQDALEPELPLSLTEIKSLLFQEKRFILLLDGLNEMPASDTKQQGILVDFREKCARAKIPFICTTRELGSTLGITRRLVIQPPAPEEIDRFLHECIPPDRLQKVKQLLNRDTRELSRTPFVLWMLYHVVQETGDVADTLGEAFRQFFQSFKGRLEAAPVTDDRRKAWDRWMKHIAFTMLNSPNPQDPGLVVPEEDAEKVLLEKFPPPHEMPSLSELLKYHLLQEEKGEISFQHQVIQEYYAALALLECLPQLSDAELQCHYLNYLKWTEPVALMLAMIDSEAQALRVVKLALQVDWKLGARLAGKVILDLQPQTLELVKALEIPEWLKIILLGETRSRVAVSALCEYMQHSDAYAVRWKAAKALGKIGDATAVRAAMEALKDSNSFVRRRAVEGLGKVGDATAMRTRIEALQDSDLDVRRRAAWALSKIGDATAVQALLEALKDSDSFVRRNAVEGLGNFKNDWAAHVLPNLRELISAAGNEYAFQALTRIQTNCKFYNYDLYQQAQEQSLKQNNSSTEVYDEILRIIQVAGKEIERKPLSFRGMNEEALRDIFLIALNTKYSGLSTGETFNKKGKTDILIRVENKNIFIAECKFWCGEKKLQETLEQLLGYATWRDDQLALLFFNRNKNFSAVLEQIPKIMREHPNFIREEDCLKDYFFCLISHPDDPQRQLKLAVLAFDVPP